ncbi:MlaE family ABC transporter permease [Amycolatopsis thermoflava]|uniref:ABC-transporter integral membrane protein n=1 Tax=Amycolatopsis methanolica 239 TaxID=1068978 RepID=A0A076N0R0_AMYME|nr:ABC transporter permease [Amycolatopsis methanolica]AIJ24671.1 ABC-transporter integral membrane protein [Amycolatopsis methanolica 239]
MSRFRHAAGAPVRLLDALGEQGTFYLRVFAWVYRAMFRYKKEQTRLLAEVGMGSGALALIGGAVAITGFMTFFVGASSGVQGYQALRQVDLTALSGFASAFINTRLAAPIIAGAGLAATVGTGITAQLGAMRINEEIDALEVMSVPSLPYLVSTRLLAGLVAVVPLYALALILSYVGYQAVSVLFYGVSSGGYTHYFFAFLQPVDILYSFLQAITMAVVVVLVHCYYGYNATGGPAGVGEAVGRAVRTSLIGVTTVTLLVALAVYGNHDTLRIAG